MAEILTIEEMGSIYKRSEDGYLMVSAIEENGEIDWCVVENFYPIVVEKANAFFGTNYIANCEED